eukprot:s374_g5.t1
MCNAKRFPEPLDSPCTLHLSRIFTTSSSLEEMAEQEHAGDLHSVALGKDDEVRTRNISFRDLHSKHMPAKVE